MNKVAILTGSGSGIGRATALVLAKQGVSVVVTDRHDDRASKVADEIKNLGGKALAIQVDVSSQDQVNRAVQKTIEQLGRVDILVNCAAGSGFHKFFYETDLPEWKSEIDIILMGTLFACRAVLPHMLKQKSGRIINVSSLAGKTGVLKRSLYSACKAGIAGFTRTVALELAGDGITVNCVSPGPINTPRHLRFANQFPELEEKYLQGVPMGRAGKPEEVAALIVFLVSDDAAFITGQDYSIDGGQRM